MDRRGLYGKYVIQKANGEPVDAQAVYFTLRLDTDAHARAAIRAYIESCRGEEPELARDLERVLDHLTAKAQRTLRLLEEGEDEDEEKGQGA